MAGRAAGPGERPSARVRGPRGRSRAIASTAALCHGERDPGPRQPRPRRRDQVGVVDRRRATIVAPARTPRVPGAQISGGGKESELAGGAEVVAAGPVLADLAVGDAEDV